MVLTTSAGLMIRTMAQLWSVNPGFDPQRVLTFGIAGSPAVHGTPTAVRNGFMRTADRLRLSTDTRYQRATEPADERWIGEDPAAHGERGKRGLIC